MPPEDPPGGSPPPARTGTLIGVPSPASSQPSAPIPTAVVSVPPTQIESVPLAPASPLVATHVIADQKALRPKGVNTRMINRANYRDTAIIFLEKHFPTPMERLFKRFGEMGAMFIILLGVVGVAIVFGVVAGAVIMHFR